MDDFEPLTLKTLGEKVTYGLIMIAVSLVLLIVLIALAAFAAAVAFGAPIAEAEGETVKIVLTDEPCRIAVVSNLPQRATWAEGGRVFEGCYARGGGLVVLYFSEDRTVVVAPSSVFRRVTGT